jgi:hypothetical protein
MRFPDIPIGYCWQRDNKGSDRKPEPANSCIVLGRDKHCDGFDNSFKSDGILASIFLLPKEGEEKRGGKENKEGKLYVFTTKARSLLPGEVPER